MKTRNELQKEVNWLKSELNEAKNAGKSASIWHEHYLNKSKQLQSELEERNQVISNLEIDAAGYRLAINDFRNDFKKLEKINIDAVSAKQLAEKDLRDIKSKSLFQLIRWWYNAKN